MRKRLLLVFGALLSILLIVLVVFFSISRIQPPPIPITPTAIPITSTPVVCSSQNSAYKTDGKHILDSNGHQFIPYGVQIEGILLAQTNWRTDGALTHLTFDQLVAAQNFWHSNTISLQLGSKALFDQSPYDTTYLAVVDRIVNWVSQLHMHIILVLQYQGFENSYQALPTEDSIRFWNILSRRYACNSAVFFDIFNEPVPTRLVGGGDSDAVWNVWANGGRINGVLYVGFQQIIDTIRSNGAQNLIFADGLAAGEDIRLLPLHTLRGFNIVYAIHPYFNAAQHSTPDEWNRWFGDAATAGNFPVVADEWSEYPDARGECLPDAPTVVPQFFAYLKSRQIGLIVYALTPGLLIRGWNFRNPTAFDRPSYTCTHTAVINLDPQVQGIGALIEEYFAQNSVQL